MEYEFAYLDQPIMVLVPVLAIVIVAVLVMLLFYLAPLPGRVAKARGHEQAEAITYMGWLGLISAGVTWAVGLIWAVYKDPQTTGDLQSGEKLQLLSEQLDALEQAIDTFESTQGGSTS